MRVRSRSSRSTTRSSSPYRAVADTARSVSLGLMSLALAACGTFATGSPGPARTGDPPPSSVASDVGRYFAIEEVGLGPNGWVTLRNYTSSAASLDTLFLCQPPRCVDLPDVVIEPRDLAVVAVGDGTGFERVAMTDAELELTPSDGEVALYSTDDVSDSSRLWAYLEWGATPHAGTATAIKAGIWHEGSYAPSAAHATRLWKTEQNLWVWDPGR